MLASSLKATVRQAKPGDYEQVAQLLKQAELPLDDVASTLPGFFVTSDGTEITGVVGVELFEKIGLLRSLAVDPTYRGQALGSALSETAVEFARDNGVLLIYLLTMTAAKYFEKQGFERVARHAVHKVIQGQAQFKSICPGSAIVMRKKM